MPDPTLTQQYIQVAAQFFTTREIMKYLGGQLATDDSWMEHTMIGNAAHIFEEE